MAAWKTFRFFQIPDQRPSKPRQGRGRSAGPGHQKNKQPPHPMKHSEKDREDDCRRGTQRPAASTSAPPTTERRPELPPCPEAGTAAKLPESLKVGMPRERPPPPGEARLPRRIGEPGPGSPPPHRAAQNAPGPPSDCRLPGPCSSGELLIEICGMKWATAVCLDKYILCYMPQPPSVC